jgi:putative sugar O-methyltransferase
VLERPLECGDPRHGFARIRCGRDLLLTFSPENKAASLLLSQLQSRISENSEFVAAEGNRSASDNGSYVACVLEATRSYKAFSVFKQDPRFRRILEHATKEQGEDYLAIVKRDSPDFISHFNAFKENDLVGGATTYDYPDVGKVSPSTLRYVKVASDLRKLFGDFIGERVAEIGGGYGGQLLVADKVLSFTRYDLLDLPPVLALASKYLEAHILNCAYRTITINQHAGDIEYDLIVSNYAFSELPSKLQRKYVAKILSKSKRGYLTMNSGKPDSKYTEDRLSLEELTELLPGLEVIDEMPLSRPGNCVIVWGSGRSRARRER